MVGKLKCHYKWCLTRRPGYVNPHKYPYIWAVPITADPSLWLEFIKQLPPDHEELENLDKVRLCHLHFEEKFIIKSNKFLVGEKVYEVPLHKWRLAPEAYPTIFTPVDQSVEPVVVVRLPEKEISTLPQSNNKNDTTVIIVNNNDTPTTTDKSINEENNNNNGGDVPSISTMYDMVDIHYEELQNTTNSTNNNNTQPGLETPERNPDDYASFNNEIEVSKTTTNMSPSSLTNEQFSIHQTIQAETSKNNNDCIVIYDDNGNDDSKALRKRKQNFETTTYLTEVQEIPTKISKTTIPIVTAIQIKQDNSNNDNETPKNPELDACYSNNSSSSSSTIDKKSSQVIKSIGSLNDSNISKSSSNLPKKPIPILPKIPIIIPSISTTTTTTRIIPTYRKKTNRCMKPTYQRIMPPSYRPIKPKETVQISKPGLILNDNNNTPYNVISSVKNQPQQNINIKEQSRYICPSSNKKPTTILQRNQNSVFEAHVNLCSTVAIKKAIKPLNVYDLSQLQMPTKDYAVNTYEHLFTISETVLSKSNVEIIRKSISLFCANWTMKFSLFSREIPRCSLGLCVSSIFDIQQVVNYFATLQICEGIDTVFIMSHKQSTNFPYIQPLVYLHMDYQYRHLNCCTLRTVPGICSFCTDVKKILESKLSIHILRSKYPSVFPSYRS